MKCPLCSSESNFAFNAKGIAVRDCIACSHRFAAIEASEDHVVKVYDDSYFFGGEAGYSDYTAEADMLVERGRMYAEKIGKYTAPGRILDVGAACGYLLKGFTDRGWSGMGLEPNAAMARLGRERMGLDVIEGSLESCDIDRRFDLVSMLQVAGHLYDPVKAFKTAYKLLNVNGLLLIESWNRESLSARLLRKHWHEYSPPSVLQWFSLGGLTRFLEGLGFETVATGRPSKRIKGSHAKSILKYRMGDNFLLNLIPDSLSIPYPSEDLFWALYRKSALDLTMPDELAFDEIEADAGLYKMPAEFPNQPPRR
jgi:SAM-dependent methyltransferase